MTGSLILVPFSKHSGLPADQFTYLVCTLIAIFQVLFMRICLPVGSVSQRTRHFYWLTCGLSMAYFQFGSIYLVNSLAMMTMTFLLVKSKIKHFAHINLVLCMAHLIYSFNQRPDFKDLAIHW